MPQDITWTLCLLELLFNGCNGQSFSSFVADMCLGRQPERRRLHRVWPAPAAPGDCPDRQLAAGASATGVETSTYPIKNTNQQLLMALQA